MLFIGSAAYTGFMVVFGILFFILATTIPEPEGTVLTGTFAMNYVDKIIFRDLEVACLVGFTFGVMALLFVVGTRKRNEYSSVLILTLIAFAVIIPLPLVRGSVLKMVNDTRVETVQVTGRYQTTPYGRHSSPSNIFRFSNGSSGRVSYNEYRYTPDGTTYYVIMNGNVCVEVFNPDEYSLPEYSFDK